MDLRNLQTGDVETLSPEAARSALLNGTHSTFSGQSINIFDPETKETKAFNEEEAKNVLVDPQFQIEDTFLKSVREKTEALKADSTWVGQFANSMINQAGSGFLDVYDTITQKDALNEALASGDEAKAQDVAASVEAENRLKESFPVARVLGGTVGNVGMILGTAGLGKAATKAGTTIAQKMAIEGLEMSMQNAILRTAVKVGTTGTALAAEGAVLSAPRTGAALVAGDTDEALSELKIGAVTNAVLGGVMKAGGAVLSKAGNKLDELSEYGTGLISKAGIKESDSVLESKIARQSGMADLLERGQGLDSQANSLATQAADLRLQADAQRYAVKQGVLNAAEDKSAVFETRASQLETEAAKLGEQSAALEASKSQLMGEAPGRILLKAGLTEGAFTSKISKNIRDATRRGGVEAGKQEYDKIGQVIVSHGLDNEALSALEKSDIAERGIAAAEGKRNNVNLMANKYVPKDALTNESFIATAKELGLPEQHLADIRNTLYSQRPSPKALIEIREIEKNLKGVSKEDKINTVYFLEQGRWDKYLEVLSTRNKLAANKIYKVLDRDALNATGMHSVMTDLQSSPWFRRGGGEATGEFVNYRQATMGLRDVVNDEVSKRVSYGMSLSKELSPLGQEAKADLVNLQAASAIRDINREYSVLKSVWGVSTDIVGADLKTIEGIDKLARQLAGKQSKNETAVKAITQSLEAMKERVAGVTELMDAAIKNKSAAEMEKAVNALRKTFARYQDKGAIIQSEINAIDKHLATIKPESDAARMLAGHKKLLKQELGKAQKLTNEQISSTVDDMEEVFAAKAAGEDPSSPWVQTFKKGGLGNGVVNLVTGLRRLTIGRSGTLPSVNIGLAIRGGAQILKNSPVSMVGGAVRNTTEGIMDRISAVTKAVGAGTITARQLVVANFARALGDTDEQLQASIEKVAEGMSQEASGDPAATEHASNVINAVSQIASTPSYGEVAFNIKKQRVAQLLDPETFARRFWAGVVTKADAAQFAQLYPGMTKKLVSDVFMMGDSPKGIEAKKRVSVLMPQFMPPANAMMLQQMFAPPAQPASPGGKFNMKLPEPTTATNLEAGISPGQ